MADYPTNSTAKQYFDIDGNPKTLRQMIREEPEWTHSRFVFMETRIAALEAELRQAEDTIVELENRTGSSRRFMFEIENEAAQSDG